MRKNYFIMFLLLGCMLFSPVQARKIITEVGQCVTDLSQIKAGDYVLFFCNGPLNPDDKEYGLRKAFLREHSDNNLFISRKLRPGAFSSSDFLWKVLTYEVEDAASGSYKITLQSARGNNLPAFTYNPDSRPHYVCSTVSPEEGDAGQYSISGIEAGDSIFFITDENGIFFNGQSIDSNSSSQQARFVGWNAASGNSFYKIYLPTVVEENSYLIQMVLNDENGEKEENSVVEVRALMGDTIKAPNWAHHTFVSAIDADTEEPVTFPYVVDGTEPFLSLTYETWPYVSLTCTDEATGEVLYTFNDYMKKGSKLALPSKEDIGIGYSLVTEGYDDYEITQNEEITLVFRRDGKNLPFEATTIENGEFAPSTKWYLMKINGSKTLSYDAETQGVLCGAVTEYTDAHLWTFVGDVENGYQIYNKQAGSDRILWAPSAENKTQPLMTPLEEAVAPNTFDINFNKTGFSWKYTGSTNAHLNDFGGNGIVKIWAHQNSAKGDGSRFTFTEYTEALGHALVYGKYISYLQSEDCVGGWTGGQLAELRDAYTRRDTAACRVAVENLSKVDTVAFDKAKTYVLISAYRDFIAQQPDAVYAMAAQADSAIVWKALEETNADFHFGFNAASDSTYFIVAAEQRLPIGGFRFGENAKCVEWGDISVEENLVTAGHPAPFEIMKNASAPASYYFVHNYGPSIITLSASPHQNAAATSGTISTYNTKNGAYNNYWRLKPVGEWSSIDNVVVSTPEQKTAVYDLSGRKVSKPTRGLYIVNGKKVYIK